MSEPAYAAIAAAAAGGAIFFSGSAVIGTLARGRQTTVSRLGSFADTTPAVPTPGSGRALRRDFQGSRRLASHPLTIWLRSDLQRAGLSWRVSDYLAFIVMGAAIAGLLVYFTAHQVAMAAAAAPVGALIPVMFIRRSGAKRSARINDQVVEVVEIIASSLRAGFSFAQSLELAAREQQEPIAGVLTRTVREIHLGISTEDALERLGTRTGDPDLGLVITAVLIQRRVGGNLAEVLQNIGQTIRDRVQVKGQIKTLTSQARLSGWIVGLLPVGLAGLLFLLSPAYIGVLVTEPMGRILLAIAGILEAIGFALVRKIAKVDY
jgi:tight adherence protein B